MKQPSTSVNVNVFGLTDVGRAREHNEDSFLIADLTTGLTSPDPGLTRHTVGPGGTILMVADGLGGAAAGELASQLAVDTVLETMRERWADKINDGGTADSAQFAAALKAATEAANSKIHSFALEHPEHRGMGTTSTIAGVLNDTLYLAQVGDSRAYLIRGGQAQQITKDQSLMQRLVDAGELTQEEAERSERRNIILQALGPESTVKVDVTIQQLREGDTLILCTDGLSGLVKPDEIASEASSEPEPSCLCERLVELANENGGPDNITAIVAHFEGDGLLGAMDTDSVGYTTFKLPGSTTPVDPADAIRRQTTLETPVITPGGTRVTGLDRSERAGHAFMLGALATIILLVVFIAARHFRGP
ncbi:MAG: PP2C family serine/threonine-protein phosphatase [Gemmatimonadaceae bacterium]